MKGPSDLIKALDDPRRYKQMASSFMPYSVGVYQMNRAADHYTRQARAVTDAIMQLPEGRDIRLPLVRWVDVGDITRLPKP